MSAPAEVGRRKIRWAAEWMPVLTGVGARLRASGALAGRRVAVVLPVDPATAYLATLLADAGAEVTAAATGATVHDDVAAALATLGVTVHARAGSTREEDLAFFSQTLARRPEVVIDDRATLVRLAHTTHTESLGSLTGACEETTSGASRLRAMEQDGTLRIPCIAVDDARAKSLVGDRFGAGQSAVNAILDRTNLLAADKEAVVVGYGSLGKGIAARLRGLAARVTVCEVDPFAALEAHHEGYDVAPLLEACARADVIVTAAAAPGALGGEALAVVRDRAVLANAGSADDTIDVAWLAANAAGRREVRDHVEEIVLADGRALFLVGGAVAVDQAAAEGRPAEAMDVTLSLQALAAAHLLEHAGSLGPSVHVLPAGLDEEVARLTLDAAGVRIDAV
ncbi:MAG TPA: adenosylhomocysteinase [Gaiellaceae bacterium]